MNATPLALALALSACVAQHFQEIATQAAARDVTCDSTRAVAIERLGNYGYRAETCEGTAFYRCWYGRKSMGRVQCCHRVSSEDEATRGLTFAPRVVVGDAVCRETP